MKTGVEGREVFPLETKQNNPETFRGFRASGFLIEEKKYPDPPKSMKSSHFPQRMGSLKSNFLLKSVLTGKFHLGSDVGCQRTICQE